MAKKKTLEQIRAEQERIREELKVRQDNLKILEKKAKELSRSQRTHRLCNHGAILEQFLSPDEFNDEQIVEILTILFRYSSNQEMLESYRRRIREEREQNESLF